MPKLFFKKIYSLFIVLNSKFDIVFFSENKIYQKYYQPLINKLLKNNYKIFYLSCDSHDRIKSPYCTNLYIGKGFLMMIILFIIKADKFITTTTNLGHSIFLKSRFVKKYYYIFHSTVSVHRAYNLEALSNYDVIFCNNINQIKEVRLLEYYQNLKPKKLIRSGYLLFDQIQKNESAKDRKIIEDKLNILIALSWNHSKKNFFNLCLIELIEELLKIKEKITLRFHPEHYKRNFDKILLIRKRFSTNINFNEDLNDNFFNSMRNSKILITDYSGISVEYFAFEKKPVIFFDSFPKIHNKKFKLLELSCFEDEIKKLLGYSCNINEIKNIKFILADAQNKFNYKKVNNFMEKNFYNYSNSCQIFYDEIKK